jgi:uncharacterized protein YfkK (UPF0435 family)
MPRRGRSKHQRMSIDAQILLKNQEANMRDGEDITTIYSLIELQSLISILLVILFSIFNQF